MLKIVPFDSKYSASFKSINEQWLNEYIGLDASDLYVLENPEQAILAKGGHILLALENDEVVGTICLEKSGTKTIITKLGVAKMQRGKGIGEKLCLAILELARKKNVQEVWLETSQKLGAAIQLYKKLGFEDMNPNNRSSRCDVVMRLSL